MKENSIEKLQERLETLHVIQDARLACNADDLDIREEIAEVEEEIKELQDDTNVNRENSIKNERSSIKEDIERLKLCSTNQCHICGRYEKEECMLERNRCEQHILSDYKRVLEINEVLLKENEALKNDYENLNNSVVVKNHCIKNSIPVQKVKDKMEEYKNMLKTCNKVKDIDRIKAINERILELQELLEGRK
nr:MAG TPA: DNA double-strand break repair protein [Caudoviricetes sp.]